MTLIFPERIPPNFSSLGLILMPIRLIDTYGPSNKRERYSQIFQIINKFNNELSDQLADIQVGHYLIDIISSKRINSLDLKQKYTWTEIVDDGGLLGLPHTDKRLLFQDEIDMNEEFYSL